MKLFSYLLFSLFLTLTANTVVAQTLTVRDEFAPHVDIVRYDSFSTTLTASSTPPPEQGSEIEVTGPTFQWSIVGATSGTKLSAPTGSSVALNNISPTNYGEAGQKIVTVRCTVSYSRRNTSTNTDLSALTDTKSVGVQFYVKKPVRVAVISVTAYRDPDTGFISPYNGTGGVWGSIDAYTLRVKDQRGSAYAYGTIYEKLDPLNPPTGNGHWSIAGNSVNLLPGEFIDGNGAYYFRDPAQSYLDSNNNIVAGDPSYSNPLKVEYEGTQKWELIESNDPTPTLLPSHHIKDWYGVPGAPGIITSTHTE